MYIKFSRAGDKKFNQLLIAKVIYKFDVHIIDGSQELGAVCCMDRAVKKEMDEILVWGTADTSRIIDEISFIQVMVEGAKA